MEAESIAAVLTAEQLEHFVRAMERRALFLFPGNSEIMAAVQELGLGWWVWTLKDESQDYLVDAHTCTCPGFAHRGECKHHRCLNFGSRTQDVPFRKADRPAKKRKAVKRD